MRRTSVSFCHVDFCILLLVLFSAIDCAFTIDPAYEGATISIDPPTVVGAVGETFSIDMVILNVSDLYGWELKLAWDPHLLNVTAVVEGSFLSSVGSSFFYYDVNFTIGCMVIDCILLGDVEGASGDGVLATATFLPRNEGECFLNLHEAVLIDSFEQLIPCQLTNGYGYFTQPHDIAITDVVFFPLTGLPNDVVNINVTVQNQGTHAETFELVVNASFLIVGGLNATLNVTETGSFEFAWNTTGYQKGDYEISAITPVIEGEADTTDNTHTADHIFTLLCAGHDIALITVDPLKTVVGQDYSVHIQVTLKNYGTSPETINTTIYTSTTALQSETANLESGELIQLILTWNTTGFDQGSYTIVAEALPVPGETEIDDNTLSAETPICVTVPGDVDADSDVDIFDIVTIAGAYNTQEGDVRYSAISDLDNDEDVDIFDVVIAASHYGST